MRMPGLSVLYFAGLALLTFALPALPMDAPALHGAKDVKWGAPPPTLPPGAQFAVVTGDPAGTGLVTLRAKLPAGYKIPPHFHPTDEHVTVLSGTLAIGMGDHLDAAHSQLFSAGGYAIAPANMHHYAWTKTGATIQITLLGPFAITYVNPADDPSHAPAK